QRRTDRLTPTRTLTQPVRARLAHVELLRREELRLDQLLIRPPVAMRHRSIRRIPRPVIRRPHNCCGNPTAGYNHTGGVPIPHISGSLILVALLGRAPELGELSHRHAHISGRDACDVSLGDLHTTETDTPHRHF